jgi:hypothetical protein
MTKKCFKCRQVKELKEFYKHPPSKDGYLGKCKECTKRDVKLYREKNITKIRTYDRNRGKLPRRIESNAARNQLRRKQHPLKYAAHTRLNNAVRDGKIEKPKHCQQCGAKTRIHGHHRDYSKPLDVIWLCQICHKADHIKQKHWKQGC